ncbi:metal ABC transporter ATP-binding protein [Prevotella sp. P5-64]|uniref:metal ABC transporter ATP-binding protein n=1 Tax=Prevotella sp. P5-64 TaxID=2024226 RepID=UPI000B96B360|nr:ABC transporter ATP-binding protein [Prevotella sp. P5-64]OYP70922.1 zinc ABC transporter [Prevotella sp. P5-64]
MSPIITLDNISASYDGKSVLEHVSLQIYPHDYLAVIGPNGGGKTTLMRVILGLKKPDAGRVTFFRDGEAVDHLGIGYLPQYSQIDRHFPISVYDIVASGLKTHHWWQRRLDAHQRRQIDDTLSRLELGDLASHHVGQLSGGQLQRVLLARAVVSNPEVLILDEPNTYIDKRFQEQMYQTLAELNSSCAIVIVSHDIATVIDNARHVACVNHTLHYHDTVSMPHERIEEHFLNI